MISYCALLRGITPSHPQMHNEKLRGVFSSLGFKEVASVLASGNIVFSTDSQAPPGELESSIQQALHQQLGIPGGTILRSHEQLESLRTPGPFQGRTHSRETYLSITFLKDPSGYSFDPLPQPETMDCQVLGYISEAAALLSTCDTTGTKTPDFMTWLQRRYSQNITTRTFNSVHKILAKLPR